MPVIIEEVTADAIKPAAPAKAEQPVTERPAGGETEIQKVLAAIRQAEHRAQRLRAD